MSPHDHGRARAFAEAFPAVDAVLEELPPRPASEALHAQTLSGPGSDHDRLLGQRHLAAAYERAGVPSVRELSRLASGRPRGLTHQPTCSAARP
ncbi:DUF6333 family protein [Streptomyces inhibens]|uniref:DUF6333 family protein n=1 Tax=Streptomyces inhibens TaxID=2293571 RepID=UPI0036CB3860